VLVTGASSGIGAELARLFAEQGARLALLARRTDRLEKLAGDLRQQFGVDVVTSPADVCNAEQCEAILQTVEQRFGGIDVLINNAGLGELGEFHALDEAAIQRMIDVNITALTRLTRRVLPAMLQRNEGWIMNVASAAAFQPMPLMSVYAASKAYVLSLSEALWFELRDHNVHVCCVCPGTTKTEFFERGGFEQHYDQIAATSMPVATVAKMAFDALAKRKMTKITGASTAMQVWLDRLFPRRVVVWAVGRVIRRMRGSS